MEHKFPICVLEVSEKVRYRYLNEVCGTVPDINEVCIVQNSNDLLDQIMIDSHNLAKACRYSVCVSHMMVMLAIVVLCGMVSGTR